LGIFRVAEVVLRQSNFDSENEKNFITFTSNTKVTHRTTATVLTPNERMRTHVAPIALHTHAH